MRTEDSIEYARAAREVGADGILITTPPYAYPTGREIALHALAIDRVADLPVLLYNYPGPHERQHGRGDAGPAGPFAQLPVHQGKSSGDPNRLHMLARDYPHIELSCGMDDQALEFFAWGATSLDLCRDRTSRQRPISPCTAHVPSKRTSTRAGGSCPPCFP